jgi:hypothetical protein
MTKTPSKEDENIMKGRKPGMDQIIRRQLGGVAYISPTLRVPYALVSRSKDNA